LNSTSLKKKIGFFNKMVGVAQALGGKVQDDEGTLYEKENYLDRHLKEIHVTPAPPKRRGGSFGKKISRSLSN